MMHDNINYNKELSIIIPAYNEEGNLVPLVEEIADHLSNLEITPNYEIIIVNDCSKDQTLQEAKSLMSSHPRLHVYTHEKQGGKSAALKTAFRVAQGEWIATFDGDGQNDPADLKKYWQQIKNGPKKTIYAGARRLRNDGFIKKWTSKVANKIRVAMLKDGTRDTGCGFKVMPLSLIIELPYFDNMHRFFPALARRYDYEVIELPVNDRPRQHGQSKYGFFDRASVALLDLIGVFWLYRRRYKAGNAIEIKRNNQ